MSKVVLTGEQVHVWVDDGGDFHPPGTEGEMRRHSLKSTHVQERQEEEGRGMGTIEDRQRVSHVRTHPHLAKYMDLSVLPVTLI